MNGFEAAASRSTRRRRDAGRRAAAAAPGFANLHSRPSSRTTAARAWTRSSRRSLSARRCTPREDGGSTRAARTRGCRVKSCSRSISRWTPAGRRAAADSLEASGRGRRTAARPLPAVGHVQQHAAARRGNPGQAAADSGDRRGGSHRAGAQGSRGVLPDGRGVAEAGARSDRGAAEEAQGPRHSDGARDAGAGRLRAAVGVRAPPRQLHGQGRAGLRRRAATLQPPLRRPDAEPPRPGALARRRGEPADGARRGQPRVGAVLRPRPRGDERRLRHAGERRPRIRSCSTGWRRSWSARGGARRRSTS